MKHIKEYRDILIGDVDLTTPKEGLEFDFSLFNKVMKIIRKKLPRVDKDVAKKEILRYKNGTKGEIEDTKEYGRIMLKIMKHEKLSKTDKKFFLKQTGDMLKLFGIVIPFTVLFPIPLPLVGTISLILIEFLFRKMGIKILPDAFYREYEVVKPKLKKSIKKIIDSGDDKDFMNSIKSEFYDEGNINFFK